MCSFLVLFVNSLLIFNVFCKNVQHRDPRFLRGTHVTTFTDTVTVTKSIPSSCVQVDATLPPCRNVRFLRFPSFGNNQIEDADARPQPKSETLETPIQTTKLGWGEYFGIYAPTATVNVTETVVTTVQDPRIVVTFAVRGCRPLKLPMDLSRCPREYSTALPIREILPTSSSVVPISPTRTPDYGFENVNEIQANEKLESTREDNDNLESSSMATEPLP